ncbi:hypothetical protein GR212_28955 [Rhizobium lusitanum]|uniref:Uncharacterized protein n=1 Tax=Rhizobium lusitanum TaxID=293958 RepID=A0A6L9UG47_9HYPH|nr:hypothetical protein [Rhizobium lusitanum]NEI73588.1 hypothetical protein [Rhizobium lusitanum]
MSDWAFSGPQLTVSFCVPPLESDLFKDLAAVPFSRLLLFLIGTRPFTWGMRVSENPEWRMMDWSTAKASAGPSTPASMTNVAAMTLGECVISMLLLDRNNGPILRYRLRKFRQRNSRVVQLFKEYPNHSISVLPRNSARKAAVPFS